MSKGAKRDATAAYDVVFLGGRRNGFLTVNAAKEWIARQVNPPVNAAIYRTISYQVWEAPAVPICSGDCGAKPSRPHTHATAAKGA